MSESTGIVERDGVGHRYRRVISANAVSLATVHVHPGQHEETGDALAAVVDVTRPRQLAPTPDPATICDSARSARFFVASATRNSNWTTGKIYQSVIQSERRGDYLGRTVQVIPHITNEIKDAIRLVAKDVDVVLVDSGATAGAVGDKGPAEPGPGTAGDGVKLVAESLAILHAHYLRADRLRAHATAVPGRVEINRYLEHNLPGIESMIATAAGEIDTSCPELIRRIAAVHPQLMPERTRDAQGFTLVHGDPNPGNILAPGPAGSI